MLIRMLFKVTLAFGGLLVLAGGIGLYTGFTASNAEWFAIPLAMALLISGALLFRWGSKQLSQQAKTENKTFNALNGWLAQNTWFGPTFLLSLIGIPLALLFMFAERTPKQFSDLDALVLCQLAIERTAREPETAKVPYVEPYGNGTEFYYAWGRETKFARMRNGLGLEVPVSASCTVNRALKQITALTIEGKAVIGP